MGIMEAIKKGFGVATKYMALVVVLFVFNTIWNLISIPLAPAPGAAAAAAAPLTSATVIFSLVFILMSVFVQGGALALVRDYIKKNTTSLKDFAACGIKYYLKLLGLGAIIILFIAIVAIIAALVVALTAPLNNQALTILAAVIAIVIGAVGLYYILLMVFAPYILVCEDVGVFEALKRSMRTVRRTIGKVLLLLIALILISLGIGLIIGVIAGLLTVALPIKIGQVVMAVINAAFNGYFGIVLIASFMAFYLGLIEKEKTSAEKVF